MGTMRRPGITRFVVKCVRLKVVKEREKQGDLDVVRMDIQGVQIMTLRTRL